VHNLWFGIDKGKHDEKALLSDEINVYSSKHWLDLAT